MVTFARIPNLGLSSICFSSGLLGSSLTIVYSFLPSPEEA